MSSIKQTSIDGALAVTSNLTIGGAATVQGSQTVGGNLTIKGWLDAKNIKGPAKGMFKTVEALRSAYANPHDGWWALVGDGFPAAVYQGDGGEWVQCAGDSGEVVIDSSEYAKAVEQMTEQLEKVNSELTTHESAFEKYKENAEQEISNAMTSAVTAGKNAVKAQDTADENTQSISQLKDSYEGFEQTAKAEIAMLKLHDNYEYTEQLKNTTLPQLSESIDEINEQIGEAGGIATLDNNGTVPMSQLPSEVKDVKNFGSVVSGVTVKTSTTESSTSSPYNTVVYNSDTNTFLLRAIAVLSSGTTVNKLPSITGTVHNTVLPSIGDSYDVDGETVTINAAMFSYYADWADASLYGEADENGNGRIPYDEKLYVCKSDSKTYRWDETELVAITSNLSLGHESDNAFPGDEGLALQQASESTRTELESLTQRVSNIAIVPFSGTYAGSGKNRPKSGVWYVKATEDEAASFYFATLPDGYTEADYLDYSDEENPVVRQDVIFRKGGELYRYDGKNLIQVGGASVGNCYNVTVKVPKQNTTAPYYSLEEAVAAVYNEGVATLGMQITYAISANVWKMYQYIGSSTEAADFCNVNYWVDMAGLNAGAEAVLNINDLCNKPNTEMSLNGAVNALLAKEEASGISYVKKGLIITYLKKRDNDNGDEWATKQFIANVEDIAEARADEQWKDFGGGGVGNVNDEPAEDGTDAFSTAGAYALQRKLEKAICDFDVTQDSDNVVIQGLNINDDPVGNAVSIPKGSGTNVGSSLSLFFDNASPVGAYGSTISTKAAFKSVTYDGNSEIVGSIVKVEILDSNGNVLSTDTTRTKASSTAADMKFSLDFTAFFTDAATTTFTVRVTDADGNVKTKSITVKAVDVTVTVNKSTQPLNYSTSSVLTEGLNETKYLSLYKFAKQTDEIYVTVDMLYKGEWRSLTTATVKSRNTQSISINPCDVFGGGEVLTHGSYPLRVQGTDVTSGVKGNIVYTAVMVINADSNEPIVSMRYNDVDNSTVKLYGNIEVEVAAYTPNKISTTAVLMIDGAKAIELALDSSSTQTITKQAQGYKSDGSQKIAVQAVSGNASSLEIEITVSGSVIEAELKAGAKFAFDFSSRSNSESDHTIKDGDTELRVNGANWSSNGFCTFLGETALRIAENVTAELNYKPFGESTLEQSGMALQFAFATKNIKDSNAKLMECIDDNSGVGFYVTGNEAVLFCAKGQLGQDSFDHRITRKFKCGEKITMAIVVEPSANAVTHSGIDYSTVKMYINGEEVGAIGYIPNSNSIVNTKTITCDGTNGDLYLYYILDYTSYYDWVEAFDNYLCKLTDTSAMISEYNAEDVLNEQNEPSMTKLSQNGMPYYVVVADKTVFDAFDGDVDTSKKFTCTLYYYHPTMPWRSFKATNVQWRRQGTTSAKRPIKNDRFYLAAKKAVDYPNVKVAVTPLYPSYDNEDALIAYQLMAINKIRVGDSTMPVDIITVKVDYSDSSNANDCGVCDMMNATFRALGSDYMTPVQRAYDGTWTSGDIKLTGLQLNHSTANHPIIAYRSTMDNMSDVYFHAKGNWKEDKGEQVALGFKNIPGYNLGCLNYGDFVEYIGEKDATLDEIETAFRKEDALDTSKVYLLSLYCGRNYRFMRYKDGAWVNTTGSMKQVNGKWVISGDVLNPVSGYELLTYNGMDWWQGVSSLDDMMAPIDINTSSSWAQKLKKNVKGDTVPAWTQYFECMVDDDNLQIDLVNGNKVPYEIFNVLRFLDSCDYEKVEAYKEIWRANAHRYMSIRSLMAYYSFTDYEAAVDQQAKNMQPMFYLEDGCSVEGGVYKAPGTSEPIIMYFNKIYDCDSCNGKDNDGGNTVPADVDPGKDFENDTRYYAGRGSILWVNLRAQQTMAVDDAGNTLKLSSVVEAMRSATTLVDGETMVPFSPEGATYFFVTQRIKKWSKKISSYDGERKYINYTNVSDLYFYALQGLGLTSLPAFIEQRWRARDGFYQTGSFKSAEHIISGRVGSKAGAVIKFKAAKSGYFAIGNDGANTTQGMYLEAGEEGVFDTFQHGDNVLLYLYQADLMSELDVSQITVSGQWDFSAMTLAERLIIGGSDHAQWVESTGNAGDLTSLTLNLPFLRELDIRNTEVSVVNAASCPRLESLLAAGSKLSDVTIAETSPIETLELPATMTGIKLVNLPNLTYPGGLTFEGMSKMRTLIVSDCAGIAVSTLLSELISNGQLTQLRATGIDVNASSALLTKLISNGVVGLDASGTAYNESGKCSGLVGRWISTELLEDEAFAKLKAYFPELSLYNSQYTAVVFDDANDDQRNITNLENGTTGTNYEASGHISRVWEMSKAYKAEYNSNDGKMYCTQLSDASYLKLADGSDFDPADSTGLGYDVMKLIPDYWYKGVNDFKNQKKYFFISANGADAEPMTTATNITRKQLSKILLKSLSAIVTTGLTVGDDYALSANTTMNVYSIGVEGMKQVRFPGVNNAAIGAVFVDENDKVVGTFNMAVGHTQFDFISGEYIFCDVPSGAKKFIFTAPVGYDTLEAIAVDSAEIEAIEPDWVFHKRNLIGVYGLFVDALMRPRSISGVKTRLGSGSSTTNGDWTYDDDGNCTNTAVPTSTMNYTAKDFWNICSLRGKGFHDISYELSKDIANLVMITEGVRDIQAICGYGTGSGYTTGAFNSYGNITKKSSSGGNLIYGIQNFVGCNWEWMDYVAVNVASFKSYKKNKSVASSSDKADAVWHVYDPLTDTERAVQGVNATDYCIGRVRFGRYCDIVPSALTSDRSAWNMNYSDQFQYQHTTGRVVARSFYNGNANGGLVYAHAYYASSSTYSYVGARLAFSGEIVIS